jgi:hypothetical protein
MYPLPGQPLPEGWTYIEHPELGRSDNPVPVESLGAWGTSGWSPCEGPDFVPNIPPSPEVEEDANRRTEPERAEETGPSEEAATEATQPQPVPPDVRRTSATEEE